MEPAVQDLINQRDIQGLYEIMTEHDDFIYCFDAAEGLISLGDKRGIDFLNDALASDDDDIREIAEELLASPMVGRLQEKLENEKKQTRQASFGAVKQRMAAGKKTFIYKTIYLETTFFISDNPAEDGDYVEALNEFGFEGWEVVTFVSGPFSHSGRLLGGHFILKKQITTEDCEELDDL